MRDITETFTEVARKRQKRSWALSHEDRLQLFYQLQESAWEVLSANPIALSAYHRRNQHLRRHSNVRKKEWEMRNTRDSGTERNA